MTKCDCRWESMWVGVHSQLSVNNCDYKSRSWHSTWLYFWSMSKASCEERIYLLRHVCLFTLHSVPHRADLRDISCWEIFTKFCRIEVELKSDKKITLYMKTYVHLWSYRVELLVWFSDKICTENHDTHSVSNTFSPEIVLFVRQLQEIWQNQRGQRW